MASSGSLDVRNAIWVVLNGDATLTSTYGATIYQQVPDNVSAPYIHLDGETVLSWETFAREGREVLIEVHCWTDDGRDDLCHLMLDRVVTLLHRQTLSVSNWTFIHCDFESSEQDSGPVYDHTWANFKVRIHE